MIEAEKAREAGRTGPGERNAGACLARDGGPLLPDLARGAKLVEALVRTQGITLYPLRPAERGRNGYTCERSEEHTSELQSLMRISYAVFCLKKKKTKTKIPTQNQRASRTKKK